MACEKRQKIPLRAFSKYAIPLHMTPPLPLINEDKLSSWLLKVGYPGKPVRWCITPSGPGKILADSWNIYDGNIRGLPLDTKLSWQLVDGKQTQHFILHEDTSSQALIPPELRREREELEKIRRSLDERANKIQEWESDVRALDIDVRKTLALQVATGKSLDERVKSSAGNLKDWEEHIRQMALDHKQHIDDIRDRDDDIAELKDKQAIAASVVYTFDKLMASMVLRHAKKFEDLKPEQIADFQRYLIDRAERHFFDGLPDSGMRLGESFTRLPDREKLDFARGVIWWTIKNAPNMINEIGREVVEQQKNDAQT